MLRDFAELELKIAKENPTDVYEDAARKLGCSRQKAKQLFWLDNYSSGFSKDLGITVMPRDLYEILAEKLWCNRVRAKHLFYAHMFAVSRDEADVIPHELFVEAIKEAADNGCIRCQKFVLLMGNLPKQVACSNLHRECAQD